MDAGPSCYWWQFPMERYCGIIVPMAHSKSRLSQSLMKALVITEHLHHHDFVIPTQFHDKANPLFPYLTNLISQPVYQRTSTKHQGWMSDIYNRYRVAGNDTEHLQISFYLNCQLDATTSIGCASQTKRVNGRADFVVCYDDGKKGIRFREVEIFALVNNNDGWARVEHMGSSHPRMDYRRRICSYGSQRGRLTWIPLHCIRAAAGVLTLNRHYCVNNYHIYGKS
ncbi:hypothetical protein NX059_012314 [Plenodomus lindquistii]|nr:hypothetical protein NX059_012314 [Plenodomus lindquistii]